ncbi:NAD-dependent epimerase/dehydratase family protein [Polaromonas aquatica]|uniref:NAD-dependent epimerase/dehydratase family protein n=1 Tax=Polaromonas aquatica TaxID=332657 RepID=UPI003D652BEB
MTQETGFKNARILVAGGAGFVGSNLVHMLLAEDPKQIIVVDNLLSSDEVNVPSDKRVKFVVGSVTDTQVLANLPDDLDYAFNLVCYHGNQSSIANPMADHDNNLLPALTLFDRLKDIKTLRRVVYAAAACAVAEKTYDDPSPTTEEQPVSLVHDSPYSISKLVGELYGNYFHIRHGLPIVKARFSNVYGPREILGAGRWRGTAHTVWRNVTPTFVWKSLNGESLPLDNGGNTSRDFIFVEDMARGLMACALRGEAGGVYNLATGRETTILELANAINAATGNKSPLDLKPARDWDRSGKRFASTEKARTQLGFEAKVSIQEGINRTVEWTRQNTAVIQTCMDQHRKQLSQLG